MDTPAVRDRITISGLRLNPRIGVTTGERRFPQVVLADVTIFGNFAAAAETDDLSRTVNYSSVIEAVTEVAHSRDYNLMESLAYGIADAVLRSFAPVRVSVRLRKKPASLLQKIDFVEFEIEKPGVPPG